MHVVISHISNYITLLRGAVTKIRTWVITLLRLVTNVSLKYTRYSKSIEMQMPLFFQLEEYHNYWVDI